MQNAAHEILFHFACQNSNKCFLHNDGSYKYNTISYQKEPILLSLQKPLTDVLEMVQGPVGCQYQHQRFPVAPFSSNHQSSVPSAVCQAGLYAAL